MIEGIHFRLPLGNNKAGARAVDLEGPSVYQGGGQSLKLRTIAAVFKRVCLLIGGGASMSIGGGQVFLGSLLAPALGNNL